MDYQLKIATSSDWLDAVLNDFNSFLLDHASCEKKASGMAMSMISHYPDKPWLINAMLNLAIEELNHFREVVTLILDRNLMPSADAKDQYINQLHKTMDQGKEAYLLDRLLIASIVEARGAERFDLIARSLQENKLKSFYQAIADSESRHYQLFLELAEYYFNQELVSSRLAELLDIEADIVIKLPIRSALH